MRLKYLAGLLVVVLLTALGLWVQKSPPSQVTQSGQIRAVSDDVLIRRLPAHLSGAITYSDGVIGLLVMQDATGGVRLHYSASQAWPMPGERVAVSGAVTGGGMSPAVTVGELKRLGDASLPAAIPIQLADAKSGKYEYRRVSLTGVVRSVFIMERTGLLSLTVIDTGGKINLRVKEYGNRDFRALVDATVRAEGVLLSSLDVYGKPSSSTLWIPSIDDIHVLMPAPDLRSLPVSKIADVTGAARAHHRVRLAGVLTTSDDRLYLADSSGRIPLARCRPKPAKVRRWTWLVFSA